jgi:hypothetical protein
VAGPALRGAPAVVPAFSTTSWDTGTAGTYATTTVTDTTPEAYVCFRCHSSYNTAIPDDPAGLAAPPWSTGGGFTNTALEFSPSNRSGHPVLASLNAYPNSVGPKTLQPSQLVGTDRTWTPGQTMTCTDCHGADAASPAAQGPHGSAIRYMLTGTNRAWPYTVAGAKSGTLFAVGLNAEDNLDSPSGNGLFCSNCHPRQFVASTGVGSNAFHDFLGKGHGNLTTCPNGCRDCVRCHLLVPHGGKVSRLIATTNTPPRYLVPGITPIFDGFQKPQLEGAEFAFSSSTYGCMRHGGANTLETW